MFWSEQKKRVGSENVMNSQGKTFWSGAEKLGKKGVKRQPKKFLRKTLD